MENAVEMRKRALDTFSEDKLEKKVRWWGNVRTYAKKGMEFWFRVNWTLKSKSRGRLRAAEQQLKQSQKKCVVKWKAE